LNYKFTTELNGWSDSGHRVDYLLEYCRVLGNDVIVEDEKLDLYVPEEVEKIVMEKMKKEGSLGIKEPLIIISPGFIRGKSHLTSDFYIDIAKKLKKELDPCYVITGSENEIASTRELVRALKSRAFDWVGRTDLQELFALTSKADLMLTVNTGTVHIAAALEVPVVGLFDPDYANSNVWRPYGVNHYIVEIRSTQKSEIEGAQRENHISQITECIKKLLSN